MSMIKLENHLGTIEVSQEYFANLVGYAASGCFGVVEMSTRDAAQGIRQIFSKNRLPDRGIKVFMKDDKLNIDLHIVVTYGLNISAIVKSIANKVSYTVQEATGIPVAKVNVYVDSMRAQ